MPETVRYSENPRRECECGASLPANTDALMQLPRLEEDRNKAASHRHRAPPGRRGGSAAAAVTDSEVGSVRGLCDIIKGWVSERGVCFSRTRCESWKQEDH